MCDAFGDRRVKPGIERIRASGLAGARVVVGLLLALAIAFDACAQAYPSRPIRLLVGLPAGGGADAVARVFARALAERLGHDAIVENRAGSGGLLAADAVAKASPDGYTLSFGSVSSHAIFASLHRRLPYDPVRDFAPVSLVATYPLVLVTSPRLPVTTMAEFIELARARPGRLSYASAGPGSPLHLAMEMLKARTGIDLVHVPYKGGVQAFVDLQSGEVGAILDALPTQLANIRAGKVRALAVTSATRNPQLPDVPTMAECGIAGFEFIGWFGLFAPAATPADVLALLHARSVEALRSPALRARLAELGTVPAPTTAEELAAFQRTEIARWRSAVLATGVSTD